MKSEEEKPSQNPAELSINQNGTDIHSLLELFNRQADDKAETAFKNKQQRERDIFQLHNGAWTSIHEEREKIRKVTEDLPQDHEPKFRQFFPALGKIAGWTEEELKSYHKPVLAAKTINEVVYDRFPKDVMAHIQAKNPYIKWCTRVHKHYLFLNDDGILLLEKFIDDAVTVMLDSSSIYDFRIKHAERFGTGFQPVLFEEYLGLAVN
jgi:hypothetical protein